MTDKTSYERELEWVFMSPMEQGLWGMAMALNASDSDGGLSAADNPLIKLRALNVTRQQRPEPEYEAARDGYEITREHFFIWYPIQYRLMHRRSAGYHAPTDEQIQEAYVRYGMSTCDFY